MALFKSSLSLFCFKSSNAYIQTLNLKTVNMLQAKRLGALQVCFKRVLISIKKVSKNTLKSFKDRADIHWPKAAGTFKLEKGNNPNLFDTQETEWGKFSLVLPSRWFFNTFTWNLLSGKQASRSCICGTHSSSHISAQGYLCKSWCLEHFWSKVGKAMMQSEANTDDMTWLDLSQCHAWYTQHARMTCFLSSTLIYVPNAWCSVHDWLKLIESTRC